MDNITFVMYLYGKLVKGNILKTENCSFIKSTGVKLRVANTEGTVTGIPKLTVHYKSIWRHNNILRQTGTDNNE